MPDQELRFERRLAHAPEKVWRAITEPRHLSQWYPMIVTELDLSLGGKVGFDDGEGTALTGVVIELDHLRVFAFTEGDDVAHFELRPHDDGCLLVFTHRFDEANASPGAAEGWPRCLDDLSTLIKASDDGPLGTLADAQDGRNVLRFERRLAHPPEKVWRALTERDELHHWFAAHVDRDLTAGATVTFTMTPEAKQRMDVADGEESFGEGEVTVAEPPRLLEYTWVGEVLRWELTPDGEGGCVLVFTDVFDGPAGAADASAGWHAALEVLDARLAGREVTWSPWDRVDPLTVVYRRAFAA